MEDVSASNSDTMLFQVTKDDRVVIRALCCLRPQLLQSELVNNLYYTLCCCYFVCCLLYNSGECCCSLSVLVLCVL